MIQTFQRLRPGDQVSASQFNRLLEVVEQLANISGQAPINVQYGLSGGPVVRINPDGLTDEQMVRVTSLEQTGSYYPGIIETWNGIGEPDTLGEWIEGDVVWFLPANGETPDIDVRYNSLKVSTDPESGLDVYSDDLDAGTAASPDKIIQVVGIVDVTATSDPTITTGQPHGLAINDFITISGVEGATGINGDFLVQTVPTPTSFTVTSPNPGVYTGGGLIELNEGYICNVNTWNPLTGWNEGEASLFVPANDEIPFGSHRYAGIKVNTDDDTGRVYYANDFTEIEPEPPAQSVIVRITSLTTSGGYYPCSILELVAGVWSDSGELGYFAMTNAVRPYVATYPFPVGSAPNGIYPCTITEQTHLGLPVYANAVQPTTSVSLAVSSAGVVSGGSIGFLNPAGGTQFDYQVPPSAFFNPGSPNQLSIPVIGFYLICVNLRFPNTGTATYVGSGCSGIAVSNIYYTDRSTAPPAPSLSWSSVFFAAAASPLTIQVYHNGAAPLAVGGNVALHKLA